MLLTHLRYIVLILLFPLLASCATIIGSSEEKNLIGQNREIDYSTPKEILTDMQLAKLPGNNIEVTLKQRILYPDMLRKEYSVTKTDYGDSHPFRWLFFTSWNPFIWMTGDIFGYEELFGSKYTYTSSSTEYENDGNTEWLDVTPKGNIKVKVFSNQLCGDGCQFDTVNGKGVFSLTQAMVDNNILEPTQLAGKDSIDLKFIALIPIPGKNVEKTITVSSLGDNLSAASSIVSQRKEAEATYQNEIANPLNAARDSILTNADPNNIQVQAKIIQLLEHAITQVQVLNLPKEYLDRLIADRQEQLSSFNNSVSNDVHRSTGY
jgi:hypothetical protein